MPIVTNPLDGVDRIDQLHLSIILLENRSINYHESSHNTLQLRFESQSNGQLVKVTPVDSKLFCSGSPVASVILHHRPDQLTLEIIDD